MKKLLCLALFLSLHVWMHAQEKTCSEDAHTLQPVYGTGNPFTLTGKLTGHEGQTIGLYKVENNEFVLLDSAAVKKGEFAFAGKINVPLPVILKLDENNTFPFILEPAKMELRVDAKNFENSEVKSSLTNNKILAEALQTFSTYRTRLRDLDARYQKYSMLGLQNQQLYTQLNAEQAKITDEQTAAAKLWVATHPKELVSANIMANFLNKLPPEELEGLYNGLSACVRNQPALQSITARINAEKVVAIGNPFVDIAAPAPNGDTLRLSDYAAKGKYTLVVFWASWCHYCQQEIPVVVELFNQYKDKDFNIFTISGDTDAAAWTNKIEEANMTFANVSELRGFESGSFKTYYIQSIPQMVLLDKEGKIIAKGNLSSGVKTKIEEALKAAE